MPKKQKIGFLNVDLDIYSKSDLAPLVRALDGNVTALYVGRESRLFSTHLELSSSPKNADEAVRRFVRLMATLPRPVQKLWNSATCRTFNIGIRSGQTPDRFELALSPATLRYVSSVKGEIVVTVYGSLKGRRPVIGNR